MNDDSLTPAAELASAALDNEVTAAERAQVLADPQLNDEMVAYAEIRDRLANVTVASTSREAALAAALSVFDDMQVEAATEAGIDAGPSAAAARVVSIADRQMRRQRQYRWLGGAAAAAVVGVLAVGVLANLGRGSEEKSSSIETASDVAADEKLATEVPMLAAETTQSEDASVAGAETATEAATDPATNQQASPMAAETTAAAGGSDDFEINGAAELSPWVAAPTLVTDDEVVAFATTDTFGLVQLPTTGPANDAPAETATAEESTAEATAATTAGDTAQPSNAADCTAGFVGPFGAALFDGQQVYVVRDDIARTVTVIVADSCQPIATFKLP